MYIAASPYWVAGTLCYIDILTLIFNQEQIDCDFRFKFQISFPSICAFAMSFVIAFLIVLIVVSILVKAAKTRIIVQWVMVGLMLAVTLFLQGMAQGYNIYPLLSITLLLAPFAVFLRFMLLYRTSSTGKCVGRIGWFVLCTAIFFLYGNSIFYDASSFSMKLSSGLFIAHRSGPENGPEGTAYTIEKTCKSSKPYAVELDIRLTSDKKLILAHDKQIDHYSHDAKFIGKNMIDEDQATLMKINVGKLWVKIDPYRQYTNGHDAALEALNLTSAEDGIKAIKTHCKMVNGTGSIAMLDVKDKSDPTAVMAAIKQLVDANTNTNFTVRVDTQGNLAEAEKVFGSMDSVTIHAAGLLNKKANFISTITFTAPLFAKYQPSIRLVSWTIQTEIAARLLAGTGSIITSDFGMDKQFGAIGGGYMLILVIAIGCFMVGLVAYREIKLFLQKKNGTKESTPVEMMA
ncbi:Glycerophosphoryl diester phosphodiesterase family protein [Spironucleus salmonicida]|uniref:Glycerophosphoryl diester phosphodiesterase family protein n=1 Tax=Spironucleus salmonicida TaxID=348837 RepID=V6M5V8_9EUKA|nr:Glycerophosphoryl diester phosphodiesterase family protein [Spironucleus salmonicida]|eukprot:EST48729.1 Glycerophosphoryl diester phosphodiesterase family protein [Spironucleus salmonicida]